jgi:hypothetical protein
MPLVRSGSKAAIQANIGKEIAAGKPPAQAAAIAYSVARQAGADTAPHPSEGHVAAAKTVKNRGGGFPSAGGMRGGK